jgi:hypothetical protein
MNNLDIVMEDIANNNNIYLNGNSNIEESNMMDYHYVSISQQNKKRKYEIYIYEPVYVQLRKPYIINTKRVKIN